MIVLTKMAYICYIVANDFKIQYSCIQIWVSWEITHRDYSISSYKILQLNSCSNILNTHTILISSVYFHEMLITVT